MSLIIVYRKDIQIFYFKPNTCSCMHTTSSLQKFKNLGHCKKSDLAFFVLTSRPKIGPVMLIYTHNVYFTVLL